MPDTAPSVESATGVHAITRNTNYWFEREVSQIEKQATTMALDWAVKGLPRHDVPRTEPLEPEQVLAKRCSQLFKEWQQRVSTKFKDAIEDGNQQIAAHAGSVRAAVIRLEAINDEEQECAAEMKRIRAESEKDSGPIGYEKLWKSRNGFWIVAGLLGIVEFMANFPVFRLLLPMSSVLSKAAEANAETVDDTRWYAGIQLLGGEISMHIEAAVVAGVAVVVLVVLAKTFGSSARPLSALKEQDHPLASQTIRAHRRQHFAIVSASGLGVACVLAFLFGARADIANIASTRVGKADSTVQSVTAELAAASSDRRKQSSVSARVTAAENRLRELQDQESYAQIVQSNNLPISLLNFALVLTAAVLGFAYKSDDLTEKRGEHPELPPLRERIAGLRREAFELARMAQGAAGEARATISAVLHLLKGQPLLGWESKVSRLETIIPIFRGENARSRGLDPANIRAFDAAPQLQLPPLQEFVKLEEPGEFARLRTEIAELMAKSARLSPSAASDMPSGSGLS